MGGMLRDQCRYCHHVFTPEEKIQREIRKKENIANSRAKAIASGKRLGRKQKTFIEDVLPLRAQGFSIRKIAKILGTSTTPVQKRLKELEK